MQPITLTDLERAAALIYRFQPPTPQYCWPLLAERAGCELWVKHENQTRVGAFKIRGGLVFMDWLKQHHPQVTGVVAATRGNHGQAIALAAKAFALTATVVVPHGNSREKNAAMRALGADLVEYGRDFQESFEHAAELARERGLYPAPSYDRTLATGAGTYGAELQRAVPGLDVFYVPIGQGSGITGAMAARDALSPKTRIIGVVSTNAAAYARSFAEKRSIDVECTTRIADGMAVRHPHPESLAVIWRGVERIVEVTDDEVETAMRAYFADTHNIAEGAGAASLAAVLQERGRLRGKKVGIVLSGGNVDREVYGRVLASAQATAK